MSKGRKECIFLWFIENYSYYWSEFGKSFSSPKFTANALEGTIWSLEMFSRARSGAGINSICVDLCRYEDSGPPSISLSYKLSIMAKDGTILCSKNEFCSYTKNSKRRNINFINETILQQCLQYLDNDILIVSCKLWNDGENGETFAPIYARTRIGIEHISFIHAVENFSSVEQNLKPVRIQSRSKKECVISSSVCFTDGMFCEKKLVVEISPSRNDHVLTKCKIAIINTFGEIMNCVDADNRFEDYRTHIRKLSLSLTKGEIMKKKSEFLTNDKLLLLCDCTFLTGIEFQRIEGCQEITKTAQNIINNTPYINEANFTTEKLAACPSIVDDLKDIYSNKFLTDVELKTKTSSFPAHKIVLCARSPVFKVMMSNDMREKNSKSIQVDDLDDNTVQNLLSFLYSDNVKDLQWESVTKLYYAADKYQIEKLKLLCSSFFIENLTVGTANEVLVLADTHNDTDLKKVVEDFILEHEKEVFCSDKWKKLMEENPQLALTTLYLKYEMKKG